MDRAWLKPEATPALSKKTRKFGQRIFFAGDTILEMRVHFDLQLYVLDKSGFLGS